MLKKAKVLNIQFEHTLNQTLKTPSSTWSQDILLQSEPTLQKFIKSPQSITETYELLNILRKPPVNPAQLIPSSYSYCELLDGSHNANYRVDQSHRRSQDLWKSKDSQNACRIQTPKTDSPFANTPSYLDQVRQEFHRQKKLNRVKVKYSFENSQLDANSEQKIEQPKEEYVYLIPQKYAGNLYLILMHFLNYKMTHGKQSMSKTAYLSKRPRRTVNNLTEIQIKNATRDFKPLTAVSQNRRMIHQPTKVDAGTSDFNEHLQKLMQVQKQLQKKTKRVMFLERQLASSYESINQKNILIKQLRQNESVMRKKLKYDVEKIAKGKMMEEVNDIYLTNVQQQKSSGRNLFEINGKRFVKSDMLQSLMESTFLTTLKPGNSHPSDKQNNPKLSHMQKKECEMTTKIQSSRHKKPQLKGANKKLELMKMTKLLESLTKEILKSEAERESLLDGLAENNARVQKSIQQLELVIVGKRMQVERCTEQIDRLREAQS